MTASWHTLGCREPSDSYRLPPWHEEVSGRDRPAHALRRWSSADNLDNSECHDVPFVRFAFERFPHKQVAKRVKFRAKMSFPGIGSRFQLEMAALRYDYMTRSDESYIPTRAERRSLAELRSVAEQRRPAESITLARPTRFSARQNKSQLMGPAPYAHFESETTSSVQFGPNYQNGVDPRKSAADFLDDFPEHDGTPRGRAELAGQIAAQLEARRAQYKMPTPRGGVDWADPRASTDATTRGVPIAGRGLLRVHGDESFAFSGSLSLGNGDAVAFPPSRTTRHDMRSSPPKAAFLSPVGPTAGVENGWTPSADSPRNSPRVVAEEDSPRFGPSSRFPIPPAGQHPNAHESMHMARGSPAFAEEMSKLRRQRAAAQTRSPRPQQLALDGQSSLATALLGGGPSTPPSASFRSTWGAASAVHGASNRMSRLNSLLPTIAKY